MATITFRLTDGYTTTRDLDPTTGNIIRAAAAIRTAVGHPGTTVAVLKATRTTR